MGVGCGGADARLLATANPMPATLTIGNGSDMTPVKAAIP
jgi:hypothetical protein